MEKKGAVAPLLDLCLFAVCKNVNGTEFLHTLPDFLRQRLTTLFKQEKHFQETLEDLNFSYCPDLNDDELKSLQYLHNLKQLNISHCEKITGISLSYIGNLKKLETLILNHSPHVSLGLFFLSSLQNLVKLEVSFCEIQDPVVPFIIGLENLKHLNLMCNRLTDEGCAKLVHLKNLTFLNLSMNPLITDETLQALSGLHSLTSLNLNFCKLLSGDGISRLSKSLPNLQQLDMNGCDRALVEVKQRPLILLAEDSKIQAKMIQMVLNRYNFDVEIATNGEMALEMFRANPRYHLILMDVLMPVMDGPTCVKQIREFENLRGLKRTPIIIQTADNRESQKSICLEAGCDEFLLKPLDKACISLAKELMESAQRNPNAYRPNRTSTDNANMASSGHRNSKDK